MNVTPNKQGFAGEMALNKKRGMTIETLSLVALNENNKEMCTSMSSTRNCMSDENAFEFDESASQAKSTFFLSGVYFFF